MDVVDPVPTYPYWGTADSAVASDGSVFLLVWGCQNNCSSPDYFVIRYGPDGTWDRSFGGGAARVLAPPPSPYVRAALAIDSADRPLAVLAGEGGLRVVRFKKNGSPDPSFGVGGEAFVSAWSTESSIQAVIGAGGEIVVLGRKLVNGCCPVGCCRYESRVQIARFLPDGRLDSSFGFSGVATHDLSSEMSAEGPILLQPDGSIVASGSTFPEGVSIVRFGASGVFDDSFGPRIDPAFSRFAGELKPEYPGGLIARPGGRIDVLGSTRTKYHANREPPRSEEHGFIARLLPNGSPDRAFGRGGAKLLPWRVSQSVKGGDGSVVGTGLVDFADVVFRLGPDGSIDRTFGGGAVNLERFVGGGLAGVDSDRHIFVVEYGTSCARTYCPPEPHIYGFLGGVSGARCLGRRATIVGTREDDRLVGTSHRDVIAGLGGSDHLVGKGGEDLICGGSGRDILNGGSGRNRLRQ